MAFALRRDESVDEGAARVAARQLTKAIDALHGCDELGLRDTVHGVRKRVKRVRAVTHLVRSGLGEDHRRTNRPARDAARVLAPAREAHVLLETFDGLIDDGRFPEVRTALAAEAAAARLTEDAVDEAIALLTEARGVVEGWSFDDGRDVLATGIRATYRRGRRAFRAALGSTDPDAFHEWRKATKQLWYQSQLLTPAAPSVLEPQAKAFHDLADLLGDDHDLAVLADRLDGKVADLADQRRRELERRATSLGARLFAEKPKAHVARTMAYLDAWDEHG